MIVGRKTSRAFAKITVPTHEGIISSTVPFERRTKDSDFSPDEHIKLITWNVASLRSLVKYHQQAKIVNKRKNNNTTNSTNNKNNNNDSKLFLSSQLLKTSAARHNELTKLISREKPDVLMIQETRLTPDPDDAFRSIGTVEGYAHVDSVSHARKGYSGVRTFVRDGSTVDAPTHSFGFDVKKPEKHEIEGRIVTSSCSFLPSSSSSSSARQKKKKRDQQQGDRIALVNTYVVNASTELKRLEYKICKFDKNMRKLLCDLQQQRHNHNSRNNVIWAGDWNVAERDYDRFWTRSGFSAMSEEAGFTPEERVSFRQTLAKTKMVDAFRYLYPNARDTYTFWDRRFQLRYSNLGWRLDGFVVSEALVPRVVDCFPLDEYWASDHCPVVLWLKRK